MEHCYSFLAETLVASPCSYQTCVANSVLTGQRRNGAS